MTCEIYGQTTMSTTGDNPSQTMTIKPCTFNCGCMIRDHGIWCNHCVDTYGIIEEIIQKNTNLPIGALMGICMKELRGKCSGKLCNEIINLLKGDKV